MKLLKFSVTALLALGMAFLGGCSDDDGIDNRDQDYGYVQFKLHKEASYDALSRAQKPQLDYLSEASKVQVSLYYDGTTITQSLTLSAPDKQSAEFGLRSEKLRLLTGQYQIITFSLFNADDELIYNGMPGEERLDIVAGGLVSPDLTVDVEPRGTVRFSISKDLSDFTETPVVTRAAERQYTFDEIAFLDLTVRHKTTNELTTFEKLPAKFSIHFRDDREDGAPEDIEDGYQTSSLECDTLLSLKAGDYSLEKYQAYDKNKVLLETNKRPKNLDFTIEDNKTTEAKVGVTLYEADEYIRDYYALYEIWKALDGEHWSYRGENYPTGVNWDFNKDPDLWGVQPGVEVHSNGRVAKIYRVALLLSAAIMAVGTALCWAIPDQLIGLFSENAETIAAGSTALRLISIGFVISSLSVISSGALEGLGMGGPSLAISLLRYVVLILPLAFVLSRIFGASGVWHAFWVTEFLTAGVSYALYRRGTARRPAAQ